MMFKLKTNHRFDEEIIKPGIYHADRIEVEKGQITIWSSSISAFPVTYNSNDIDLLGEEAPTILI